jgi:hypothetical protein
VTERRKRSLISGGAVVLAVLVCLSLLLPSVRWQKAEAKISGHRYKIYGEVDVWAPFGTASPEEQKVWKHRTAKVKGNPQAGYHVAYLYDNQKEILNPPNPYVINDVEEEHEVMFGFEPNAGITVTASVSGGNGTVSPASQTYNTGDTATVTMTPDPGYGVGSIVDNGTSKPVASPYVISNVTGSHGGTGRGSGCRHPGGHRLQPLEHHRQRGVHASRRPVHHPERHRGPCRRDRLNGGQLHDRGFGVRGQRHD